MTATRARWMRALMACLWAIGLVRIFVDEPILWEAAVALLVLYLLLALPVCDRLSWMVAALAGGGALAISAWTEHWRPLVDGVVFSLVFTTFLPTVALLRTTIDVSPEVWRSRAVFGAMPPMRRTSAMLVGGGVPGAVLTLGVFPILAPLVPRGASAAVRGDMARACLRGLALCLFWSPFTVNMAIALAFRPDVPLWQVIGVGLPLAAVGAGLSLVLFGRGDVAGALRALAAFRPIVLPLGGAVLTVIAIATLTPLGTIETIVLVMPVLCAAWLRAKRPGLLEPAIRRTYRRLDRLGGNLLIFVAAVALARVLLEAPFVAALLDRPAIAALPAAVILGGAMLVGFTVALLGAHSLVLAALIIALLSPFSDRIAGVVAVMAMLYGAACGASISVSALSVLVAATSFQVPVPVLLFRQNTAFMAVLGAVVFAILAGLNRILTG